MKTAGTTSHTTVSRDTPGDSSLSRLRAHSSNIKIFKSSAKNALLFFCVQKQIQKKTAFKAVMQYDDKLQKNNSYDRRGFRGRSESPLISAISILYCSTFSLAYHPEWSFATNTKTALYCGLYTFI